MSDENGGGWVSVGEAADALGISERAIQKRCKAGKMRAELVTTDSGTQWQIAADEIARAPEPVREPNELSSRTDEPNEPVSERAQTKSGEPTNLTNSEVREPAPEPNEPSSRTSSPEMMAHLMEENRFLRGVVESQARDAAELRAALREALKMSHRALNEGASKPVEFDGNSSPQVLAEDGNAAPESAQIRVPDAPAIAKTPDGASGPNSGRFSHLTAWQRIAARILGIR